MVKLFYHLPVHNLFQVAKVNYHSILCVISIYNWFSYKGYIQPVGMSVDILTRTVIIPESMGHFKAKLLGYSYFTHFVIGLIVYKNNH